MTNTAYPVTRSLLRSLVMSWDLGVIFTFAFLLLPFYFSDRMVKFGHIKQNSRLRR